ncbi:peptide deformylase [Xanthocytophaga agilis]|uniref:Peptide deformylase n=1 Tax=Xanthocytophaga agilis TaxID=3048010 RepID=A0AAE3UIV3_9BACT|nr:peptide deformylase [Xanthocytophaga agilis]MDJ1504183.1 peptide deformylase [Xanthocytophaga agilis]
MILPVVAYGMPVLRKKGEFVSPDYPDLPQLIANMWDTMDYAGGVGLAAPQVNVLLRLFIIDSTSGFTKMHSDKKLHFRDAPGIRKVFLNPVIEEYSTDNWLNEEGCLSIPDIHERVSRSQSIVMSYQDEQFAWHTDTFFDETARIIQHEYDHIEGKLFLDTLSPLRRRLLEGKLKKIGNRRTRTRYPMLFAD